MLPKSECSIWNNVNFGNLHRYIRMWYEPSNTNGRMLRSKKRDVYVTLHSKNSLPCCTFVRETQMPYCVHCMNSGT
jgi:hypothetical protein